MCPNVLWKCLARKRRGNSGEGFGATGFLVQHSCAQNKTPRARFESETYVDQPSPKCCSRKSIDTAGEVENGTEVPYLALGFPGGQNSALI